MECGHDIPLSLGCSNHRRGVGIFLLVKNVQTVSLNGHSTYDADVYIYIVIFIYGRMYSISYSYVVRLNDLLIHYIASNFVISLFSLGFGPRLLVVRIPIGRFSLDGTVKGLSPCDENTGESILRPH